MKRKLILAVLVAATMPLAVAAQAHNFTGDGNCDGWNLVLDGTWNAHTIYVDGVDVALDLTVGIPDASAATSRVFVVLWDKVRGDVTVTHTLYRQLDCPTTTTGSTTTTGQVTTTTEGEVTTTTEQVTTTTGTPPPETTVTTAVIEQCPPGTVHVPPFCVETEVSAVTTAAEAEASSIVTEETLPFTGISVAKTAGVATAFAGAGVLLLLASRRRTEDTTTRRSWD